jgi:mono/diheme cytochrome c family protein
LENDDRAPGTLRRVVLLEAGVAALVFLSVGWLTSLEPARQYAGRHGIGVDDRATHVASVSGTTMSIAVEPAQVGANTIRVELKDAAGHPIVTATDVRVRVRSLEQDLGEQQFSLEDTGGGIWGANDHRLNIPGQYQLDLMVARSDAFDAKALFRFEAVGAGIALHVIRPATDTTWTLFGIQLALLGALCLGVASPWLRSRAAPPRRALLGVGGGLAVAGLLIAINVNTLRIGFAEELLNPFPVTSVSTQNGLRVYMATCASCHGLQGRGDGPAGEELIPPPTDLIVHVPLRTDSALYRSIRDGVRGTRMPPQKGNLTDEEMWHLVNFLRAMADAADS